MAERTIINGLLTKLGVADADKLNTERANTKLVHRLTKAVTANKLPELTDVEAALITELGIGATAAPAPAAKKGGKKVTPAPAAKDAAEKKVTPAPAAKDAAEKKERTSHGAELFKAAFEKDVPVDKLKLVEKMVAAGVTAATASAYVVWAKRPLNAKTTRGGPANPWGFRLDEAKDDKGVKFLTRTTKAK